MINYPINSQEISIKKPSKVEQIKSVKIYYQKLISEGKSIDDIRQKIVQETGVVI